MALPFLAAAVAPLVHSLVGERTAWFASAVALACLALVASLHGTTGTVTVPWIPALGVSLSFYVDGLAVLVGYLATGVGVLILAYSRGYMVGEPGSGRYYATLLAFMGSMLGVAFASDLVALFVFWELTSVSSFLLVGHYREDRGAQAAARKALLVTVAGGLFMLVGFLLLHAASAAALGEATFDLTRMLENPEAMRGALRESGLFVPVLGLLAVGAAAKSAQVPLHVWLPDAMAAPTPVSAFLHSATMVKAGVYLVGRFRPLLGSAEWTLLFAVLGLTTMTVTAALAVAATDIKRLLAYSTASHLGLIVAGFAFAGDLGGETGTFHLLNHATFKAALFLVAGVVAHAAGTRSLSDLGGLRRDLPGTAAVATVAALAMAGIPPLNGFYSKELLFETTYEAAAHDGGLAWLAPVVAVGASVLTVVYSLRFLGAFYGDRPGTLSVHRPPRSMLVPPAVLGALVVAIGLAPNRAIDLVVDPAFVAVGGADGFSVSLPTHLTPPVLMSAVTIVTGVVLYRYEGALGRIVSRAAAGPRGADWYYDRAVSGLDDLSAAATPVVQNGHLRTYAAWTVGTTSVLALAGYAAAGVALPAVASLGVAAPVAVVLTVLVVGVLAVGRAPSHVAGVLALSVVGFMVAIFYILASAPDLALTQLVVETLTLVIFLLVLDKLPAFYGGDGSLRRARDAAVAAVVGGTVALTVLVATADAPPSPVAEFFVRVAVDEAGGHNVVNVVLVDFRAFDTMGEISVVAMAALSVLTLVAMRERGEIQ